MKTEQVQWVWLDAAEKVSSAELSEVCGMSAAELEELVDYGALMPLQPLDSPQAERMFSAEYITPLRMAGKLRVDFDLDLFTVALLLGYVHRIEALERQLRSLEAHIPSYSRLGFPSLQPPHSPPLSQ